MTNLDPAGHGRRGRLLAVVAGTGMLSAAIAGAPAMARAEGGPAGRPAVEMATQLGARGDGPAGFWYGTDSTTMAVPGPAPYREPVIGGAYGGYIGMIGNWAAWQHCGGKVVWSGSDSADADTDLGSYHDGIGTGVYWFMAGPGVDPHYNGTTTEAAAWGARQAAQTLGDIKAVHITYPVVFMDIELPGIAPAPDNGWNAVYTAPCSGRVKTGYIAPAVDRADFNGYRAYILAHSVYIPGVYSAPSIWASIFGTGSAASIPTTDEWTYNGDTSSLSHLPSGWCLTGTSTCAQFFGGGHSSGSEALIWQWTGGGGT